MKRGKDMKLSNKKLFVLITFLAITYGILYWVIGNYLTTR